MPLLKSRKFIAALVGIAGVILTNYIDIPEDQLAQLQLEIVGLIGLYIGGTAWEDGQAKRAGKGPKLPKGGAK